MVCRSLIFQGNSKSYQQFTWKHRNQIIQLPVFQINLGDFPRLPQLILHISAAVHLLSCLSLQSCAHPSCSSCELAKRTPKLVSKIALLPNQQTETREAGSGIPRLPGHQLHQACRSMRYLARCLMSFKVSLATGSAGSWSGDLTKHLPNLLDGYSNLLPM